MIKIVFKNLESSQLVKEIIRGRIEPIIGKYPSLIEHKITITLEMENSPQKAGPDLFTVSSMVHGKSFKNLRMKKSSENLYLATAELIEGFNELLSQENDRLLENFRKAKFNAGVFYE